MCIKDLNYYFKKDNKHKFINFSDLRIWTELQTMRAHFPVRVISIKEHDNLSSLTILFAPPAKAAPKVKAPKKKVAKAASTHPPYSAMIVAAITSLKDRKGSSHPAIAKYGWMVFRGRWRSETWMWSREERWRGIGMSGSEW